MWPAVAVRSTPRRLFGSKRPEHCDLELWGVARRTLWEMQSENIHSLSSPGSTGQKLWEVLFFRPTVSPAETQRMLSFSVSCVPWTPPSLVSPSHLGGPSPPPALGHWGCRVPIASLPEQRAGDISPGAPTRAGGSGGLQHAPLWRAGAAPAQAPPWPSSRELGPVNTSPQDSVCMCVCVYVCVCWGRGVGLGRTWGILQRPLFISMRRNDPWDLRGP